MNSASLIYLMTDSLYQLLNAYEDLLASLDEKDPDYEGICTRFDQSIQLIEAEINFSQEHPENFWVSYDVSVLFTMPYTEWVPEPIFKTSGQ